MFSEQDLRRLIIPLVIEQFLALFIGMADTVMVSTVSESAVSAISLVDSINVLLIQLFSAMATGGSVVAAQYLGRRDNQSACNAAKQLMYVSTLLAAALGVVAIVFANPLLTLCFGTLPEDTLAYCRTYLYLSAVSYPALALYNGGAALLRAMNNSKASMYTSLMMNVFNVGGNALLIYGLNMEVAGAGTASLLARMLGAGIMVWLLLNRSAPIHLIHPMRPEPDGPMIVSIIAANAISNNIASLCNLPGTAIGLAIVTVVGQCVGAGDVRQARYYANRLILLVYGFTIAVDVVLFIFARPLAGIFNLSPEALDASEEVLRWYAVAAAIFWPASFTVPNALRAAGDARFTMGVSVSCMWVFRIGTSYLLVYSFDMGLLGIWVAMFIDWVVRGAFFVTRYLGSRWLTKRVV